MNTLETTIARIAPLDEAAMAAARARHDTLTKPRGSLGRLEALAIQIAGITREPLPELRHKVLVTMAGDHGVAADGVSAYPPEVTAQMVANFSRGGAAINVLARHVGARNVVVDVGVACDLGRCPGVLPRKVAPGTRSLAAGPAMSREEAVRAIEVGIDVAAGERARGMDIVGVGDMGIGNTTPASAITAAITGRAVAEVTGRGTGICDERWAHKVAVIERALAANRPDPADALDVLSKVGGLEIAGIVGVILGAAALRVPVMVDGFVAGAGALLAAGLAPGARPYLIAAHRSVECGHGALLEHLGLSPLLDLGMRLGEGTGAALGIGLAEAAVRVLAEMATFAEAGVTDRE